MNQGRFSAADLEPTDAEERAVLRAHVDRIAAILAVLAAGVVVGGMIALGAPSSGNALGAAFARFDQIALGAAAVLLGVEIVRAWAAGPGARGVGARVRRLAAVAMAGCVVYTALMLTPQINRLHGAGARRDAVHRRAELVGKAETALGVALVALHVLTLALRRPEDDVEVPAPPGPEDGTMSNEQ